MVVADKGQIVTVTQIRYNPCANTPAPDFTISTFNINYNNPPSSLQTEFTSNCWKINSKNNKIRDLVKNSDLKDKIEELL